MRFDSTVSYTSKMRRRADVMMDDDDETVALDGSKRTIRNSIHSVSVLIAFGVIAVLLGLFGVVYTIDRSVPTALTVSDEPSHPEAFIAERARHDLKLLTGLGPRVAGGYENEVLTVDFLKREISFIQQRAHKNQKIEVDFQVVSGCHYIHYKPHGKFVPYANLQNVVVKLFGANNGSSVLINSHFDSVPTSPGGSDDGINVAIMLEVLRKLSREAERLQNNLIFLFNGAEETGLQASHGFITQHKWAKECKVVVNLEAAGHGGKIILFQSGPSAPWLLKYYAKVKNPYGQVAGEEIFQSGLVPSDTDFRIFRDYGGLVGLDFAFYKNGYRYHTKYDDFEHLPFGSIQHVGDTTLSLARSLGNAPEVADPKANPGKAVYFDYLSFFIVTYTETTGLIVNSLVVVFSVLIFLVSLRSFKLGYNRDTLLYFMKTFGAILGGWILAAIFVFCVAFIIDKISYPMTWYANPWLIFGLYVGPTIGLSSVLLPLGTHQKLSHSVKAQIQAHCVRLIWTLVLLAATISKIRAAYSIMIPVLFNTLGFTFIHIFTLQHTIRKWQVLYVISLVIPTIFLMYTSLTTLSLFIPLTGRIGPDKNPEMIVGMITLLYTILITSYFVALSTLVRNFKILLIFLGVVFLINFILTFTPLGFPYTGNPDSPAAERYWILHTRRAFHNEDGAEIKRDSGYFLLNMDRNSPSIMKDKIKEIGRIRSLEEDCEKHLLCGLPLVHSKMIQIIKFSSWIPAGPPVIPESTKLDVISKEEISPSVLRYNVSISGPDRIGLYFSPQKGMKILNISLASKMPQESAIWNDRELYFIIHVYGKEPAPLKFTFDVQVPKNFSDVTTEIAISGIFVHDYQKMPHFVQFLNEFPNWADVTAWLGTYESWWI